MILLHKGSGSTEVQLLEEHFKSSDWERLRGYAIRLLEAKGELPAAKTLREIPFVLHEGTNGFADDFTVLHLRAPLPRYLELGDSLDEYQSRHDYEAMAKAVSEVSDTHVRFVAVDLDTEEGPEPVSSPSLATTSDVVERALRDAERLIATEGATSGVDRLHTAFHGYLFAVARKAELTVSEDANVTELFRIIRERHPGLQQQGARQADIDKAGRALAKVVDTLNPVRNNASVAHPNDSLLDEPEAMLVINAVKTLLHYLDARTRS